MSDYSTKSVCCYDTGLWPDLAAELAKSFGRTYYYVPGREAQFPKSSIDAIGRGLPGVERINTWLDHIPDVDLWVFPDIWSGSAQKHLAGLGKRVWGSRDAEMIETMRLRFRVRAKELGIPIAPYEVVTGFDDLREYVKTHPQVWVKLSGEPGSDMRADAETWQAKSPFLAEQKIREYEYKLGDRADTMVLLVEEDVPDTVEIAYDGHSVDGVTPRVAMWGVEDKAKAYLGRFSKYDALPAQLRDFNTRIAGDLEGTQCRSWFGCEMRVRKDGSYVAMDPLARFGSPGGEASIRMVTNIADVMWQGAGGVCVDPIPRAVWCAEIVIYSEWAAENHQPIEFPDKFRDNILFRNVSVRNGKHYILPQQVPVSHVCGVVGWGRTQDDAIEMAKEVAGSLEGPHLDTSTSGLDAVNATWAKLKDHGVL